MMTAEQIRSTEDASGRSSGEISAINVGSNERLASKIGGGILPATGLLKGGVKGLVIAGLGAGLLYRGSTGHCALYKALDIDTADDDEHGGGVSAGSGVRVEEEIVVARSPEEVYRYWRNYANLPRFMADIESVTGSGARSHWVMKGPLGASVEWDSDLIRDEPGRMMAWESVEGSQLETAGSVHFDAAPDGRSTVVRINQKFNPPGGKLGVAASTLIGHSPAAVTRQTLRQLKEILEAGPSEGKPRLAQEGRGGPPTQLEGANR